RIDARHREDGSVMETLASAAARTTLTGLSRGAPAGHDEIALDRIGALGLRVPAEDLMLPVMTVSETAFAHNLEIINRYAAEQDVSLCPHGKTMMVPQLLETALAGSRVVGLCAATVPQAAVMAACGAPAVFVVNQIVGRTNLQRFADMIRNHPATRFL